MQNESSMKANIGATGNPGYDEAEMEEVKLDDDEDDKPKKSKKDSNDPDLESDGENANEKDEDEMSASFNDDDDPSTVDLAEKREQEVRKSLLFAILTACGMIFCMNMIGRLIDRCSRSEDTGADDANALVSGQDYATNTASNQAA